MAQVAQVPSSLLQDINRICFQIKIMRSHLKRCQERPDYPSNVLLNDKDLYNWICNIPKLAVKVDEQAKYEFLQQVQDVCQVYLDIINRVEQARQFKYNKY